MNKYINIARDKLSDYESDIKNFSIKYGDDGFAYDDDNYSYVINLNDDNDYCVLLFLYGEKRDVFDNTAFDFNEVDIDDIGDIELVDDGALYMCFPNIAYSQLCSMKDIDIVREEYETIKQTFNLLGENKDFINFETYLKNMTGFDIYLFDDIVNELSDIASEFEISNGYKLVS